MEAQRDIIQRASRGLRPLAVRDLGLIDYDRCWDLQRALSRAVASGDAHETLLLLEHPHTFTCGRRGGRGNILISGQEIEREGISVLDVDRGGDVTYHGPGQLVAYPIISLRNAAGSVDYPGYVRDLEDVLVDTLAGFNIPGEKLPGFSGVWVRDAGQHAKVAAIGVKVDAAGVTTHGIALNVSTDLSYFAKIVPCGITDKGVTSMHRLLGSTPPLDAVKRSFAQNFAARFGFVEEWQQPDRPATVSIFDPAFDSGTPAG